MREIPVFYHIPRCAGTFLKFNVMIPSLRKNHQKENDELKQTNKEIPWCQLIRFDLNLDSSLVMPGKITFIVRTAMNKLFCPKFENTVTIDKFKEYLEKDLVMIVGATINPIRGSFNQSVELIEDFCKMSSCKPKYFTLMRDPFEWHNSFFHYLRDVGKWEPTYGFFENTTFKEYLTSEKISDGWLIRNLNEIPNEKPLTEKDYEKAIE
ncbi:MAG: hypothetical protein HN878_04295, partial [Candidatus Diapherotrites archaeon]|nr:hypothetical protein [Candidatus Diapherotrites archaeon]